LDEVDYMTKNAQQALRYLLQSYSDNVRFCLICNYISKIDIGLQNEFLKLRFNQLPKEDIIVFLNKISVCENLNMSKEILHCVQQLYKSDIRSMVNFMQSNQDILDTHYHIIDKDTWETLINQIKTSKIDVVVSYVLQLSRTYNMDKKNIITDFLNYIIRNYKNTITTEFLNFVENTIHFQEYKGHLTYSLLRLSGFLTKPTSNVSILT
jgi:DNA polymerase III delta prime subunit